MGVLVRLALRNLARNLRRTLITVAAVSGGIALFFASMNLATGMYRSMIDLGVSTMAGHVVVQGEGFQASQELDIFVPQASQVEADLQQMFPDAQVLSRTFMAGLLNSATNSVGVAVTAVAPEREVKVSDWQDKIVEGTYLTGNIRDIVIGRGLSETLEVTLGDKVVLMAQGDGDVASQLFRVCGIFQTGSAEMDGFFAIVPLEAAQEVTGQPNGVTQVTVHLPNPKHSLEATATAKAGLQGPVEVLDWKRALPEIWNMIQADAQGNNLFIFIMGIMVAMGVLNTVLMSVMERLREFGVMLALGISPKRLAQVIVLEGLFLGIISATLGALLGLALTYPMVEVGLDLSGFMGESMDMAGITFSTKVFAAYDWVRMTATLFGAVLMCIIAAIYPAMKAAKLNPVEAMRHI